MYHPAAIGLLREKLSIYKGEVASEYGGGGTGDLNLPV
jgi:hypothetical protein